MPPKKLYLYLLAGLFALLGGCSRCERDDAPAPVHEPLSIIMSTDVHEFLAMPTGSMDDTTWTDTCKRFLTDYTATFAPSDLSYSRYKWNLHNGQTYHTRTYGLFVRSEEIGDSLTAPVTLTAYTASGDSATVTDTFTVCKVAALSPPGLFEGRFNDGSRGTIQFRLSNNLYLIDSFVSHICPDRHSSIRAKIVAPNAASWNTGDYHDEIYHDPICYPDAGNRPCPGFAHFFGKDSVRVQITLINHDNTDSRTIKFKGKRL